MASSRKRTSASPRPPVQIVGNSGLHYVCYSMDGKRVVTLQVKSLSRRAPVPLGGSLDRLMGDFWIIATRLGKAPDVEPTCYVMTPRQVRSRAHRGIKDGKVSYWLQPSAYDIPAFRERWERIGQGF